MANKLQTLYEQLRSLPFPELGKTVGDFPMYDALVAGYADRAARGDNVESSEIPEPDDETARRVATIRDNDRRTAEEIEFLGYFELLEQIRQALRDEGHDLPGPSEPPRR